MPEISVLIPARDEPYIYKTIADILKNAETKIEIIVGLDGWVTDTYIFDHRNVDWIIKKESVGQRAMTNMLARQATGKYLMKIDAHCSFGPGFDRIMLEDMDDKTILAPHLMPLDGEYWTINPRKKSSRYYFDRGYVMQYDKETEEDVSETMCLQGSAWMVLKENYWKWNLCDEFLGSWGSQAVELGIKAFLNGGVCKTTKKTFYGHVFRTTDADFPYDRGLEPGKKSNEMLKKLFPAETITPLVEKFGRPGDWAVV